MEIAEQQADQAETAPPSAESDTFEKALRTLTGEQLSGEVGQDQEKQTEPPGSNAEASEASGEPTPSPEPEESKADYYAKLSEMDRQNRVMRNELKKLQESTTTIEQLSAKAKQDPTSALGALGLELGDVLDAFASKSPDSNGKPTLPSKAEEISQKTATELEQLKQQVTQERQMRLIQGELSKVESVVDTHKDEFPLMHAAKGDGGLMTTLQTAAAYMNENAGQVPEYRKVVGLLEEHGRENAKAQFDKLIEMPWYREHVDQRLTSKGKSAQTVKETAAAPEPKPATVEPDTATPAPKEPTEEMLFDRALAAMTGKK